jgi:hypothetical protein
MEVLEEIAANATLAGGDFKAVNFFSFPFRKKK